VSRDLVLGRRCASATEVKGYYTYTSAEQTWTLYIVGEGSAQIDDTIMDSCTNLASPSVSNAAPPATSGIATAKSPGNVPVLPSAGSNSTKGTNGTNATECYEAWCFG
jgi:hypothetical protein